MMTDNETHNTVLILLIVLVLIICITNIVIYCVPSRYFDKCFKSKQEYISV